MQVAAERFTAPAGKAELAAFGLTPEDYADDVQAFWPDTALAVEFFLRRCCTQWRTGMSGPTGLDYPAVYSLMDRMGLSNAEWGDLFDDIQTMESAALVAIHGKDDD